MTLDDLLDRMRQRGMDPHEEDFIDDYGLIATRNRTALKGRTFRCMFAATRVEELRFETYIFSSVTEAMEFEELMGDEMEWNRRGNLVFHAAPKDRDRLNEVLDRTFDTG